MKFPSYPKKAHRSGQARIRIHGREHYLGTWGSKASHIEYARLMAEFASGSTPLPTEGPGSLTISQLVDRWFDAMKIRYSPTSQEHVTFRQVTQKLLDLYADTRVDQFDVRSLRAVRTHMIASGWAKGHIQRQITRIRTMWRWAESERLVPAGTWHHLQSLPPIGSGEKVRQTKPREPVPMDHVRAVMPYVPPVVRAMILFQLNSGARPAEVMTVKANEIDRSSDIWVYTPCQHKNAWRGAVRKILIGPEAQKAILPWLEAALAIGDHQLVFPSKEGAYKRGYGMAITRACKKAGVPSWCPYRLRHTAKLQVTQAFGLDAARAFLGQKSLEATNGYAAQQDLETAAKVARKVG